MTDQSNGPHPSHELRFSFDASSWDEICVFCGLTDQVPGGWGKLTEPCTATEKMRKERRWA